MIDTLAIYNDLRNSLGDEAAGKMAQIIQTLYQELSQAVTKQDFNELRAVVHELVMAQQRTEARLESLAEAQQRTEKGLDRLTERVDGLAERMEELAEAQRKTEARLESLAEAQQRTEKGLDRLTERVDGLAERMEELAEAQRKTEARLESLAEAQRKTEERVDKLAERMEELAEAQRKTEETVRSLVKGQAELRKQVGGLSNSFGYLLEDVAIRSLPGILESEIGVKIEVMDRRFLVYPDGGEDEINIYGEGRLDGEKVYVIGESKSQLGKKDVDRFRKLIGRVSDYLKAPVIPVIVMHMAHPKMEVYAREKVKDVRIYKSFQLKG